MSDMATTGFVNNGSLVQYGSANTSDQWDYLTLGSPKKTWRILINGDLPAGGKKMPMSVSVYEGTIPLFSATGTWKVQGQSSSNADKKNWDLRLTNPTTGNPLSLKIGDWLPLDRVVLKAYASDRTLIRDIVTTALCVISIRSLLVFWHLYLPIPIMISRIVARIRQPCYQRMDFLLRFIGMMYFLGCISCGRERQPISI